MSPIDGDCPVHRHLPSPLRPAACTECHPSGLSQSHGVCSIGTTPVTVQVLSDIVHAQNEELVALRQRNMELERLGVEHAADMRSLKRDLRELRKQLTRAQRQLDSLADITA